MISDWWLKGTHQNIGGEKHHRCHGEMHRCIPSCWLSTGRASAPHRRKVSGTPGAEVRDETESPDRSASCAAFSVCCRLHSVAATSPNAPCTSLGSGALFCLCEFCFTTVKILWDRVDSVIIIIGKIPLEAGMLPSKSIFYLALVAVDTGYATILTAVSLARADCTPSNFQKRLSRWLIRVGFYQV